mgnify:CR=1 FL=1
MSSISYTNEKKIGAQTGRENHDNDNKRDVRTKERKARVMIPINNNQPVFFDGDSSFSYLDFHVDSTLKSSSQRVRKTRSIRHKDTYIHIRRHT